jgi:hypothetical protein
MEESLESFNSSVLDSRDKVQENLQSGESCKLTERVNEQKDDTVVPDQKPGDQAVRKKFKRQKVDTLKLPTMEE